MFQRGKRFIICSDSTEFPTLNYKIRVILFISDYKQNCTFCETNINKQYK